MLKRIHLLMRKNGVATIQLAAAIMVGGLVVAAITVFLKRGGNAQLLKSANYLDANDGLVSGTTAVASLKQFEPDYVDDKMTINENTTESLGIQASFDYSKTGTTTSTGIKIINAPAP